MKAFRLARLLRLLLPLLLLWPLSGCLESQGGLARLASAPPLAAGYARVWFLRQYEPYESLGQPAVFANGTPLFESKPGTVRYRDLRPGAYTFSVASYGFDRNQEQTVALAPGQQRFLEIQSLQRWFSNFRYTRDTFYVAQIEPPWAEMLMSQMADLGAQ